MSDLYENLLKATSNIDDITTEKYGVITKLDGLYCSVKETDNELEHNNVPIVNGANLSVGDKVIIGFLNNSIYDVVCYGALDKTIHDDSKQDLLVSGTNIKTINHQSLLGSGNITIQGGGGGVDVVTSWEATLSDSKVPSEKLVKNTIDGLSIPTKTSDLTNDGADGTNVYVANNDSRLSDSRTPTSHTHGNLTNDGKLGTTSGKPVITTTGGAITTGSFGSTSGTFAEGNHTHSGYVSATKVTIWQSTPSDSNVPSEKLVKDYVDGLIGSAISYIVGSGN